MIDAAQIVEIKFSEENEARLEKYVLDQIRSLTESTRNLFEQKVKKWRKIYRGVPKSEKKDFPWQNAANLVIQLVGTNVDICKAAIMGSIFEVSPLFPTELIGDWPAELNSDLQQKYIEEFLNLAGRDNQWLDLYRVYSSTIDECVKFGTVFTKTPWVTEIEQVVAGYSQGQLIEKPYTKYDGPAPEKLRFENFLVTPNVAKLSKAPFQCHIVEGLSKMDLEYRAAQGIYSKVAVDEILKKCDRFGPTESRKEENQAQGIQPAIDDDVNAQWDLHECWFTFNVNDKKYSCLATVHKNSKTFLKKVFNFYPDNDTPFDMARLGYTEDGIYGYGFCEMLEHYQEEVSTLNNQDIDNRTLLNTAVLAVGKDSKLDANFSLYPNCILPLDADEVKNLALGNPNGGSIELQSMISELARVRAGVDQGFDAPGAGTVNPKKGTFSAMGTFAVMQAGNRRSNINITDIKYFHANLGRRFLKQYAHFDVGETYLQRFGEGARYIKEALASIKAKRLDILVKAATASVNKEIEKQSIILMGQNLQRHYQSIAGLIQSISNPAIEQMPMLKYYLTQTIKANNCFMGNMLKLFDFSNVSKLLPEGEMMEKIEAAQRQQQAAPQQQGTPPPQGAPPPNAGTSGNTVG